MSYTGNGTESDPYLVSRFDDFLICANISGAYVKIIADIDASKEEKYLSSITRINISAAKIYADKLTEISNFIVLDSTCFYKTSGTSAVSVIRNIDFKNVTSKLIGTSHIFNGLNDSQYLDFYDCKFSIQAVCGTSSLNIAARTHFERCAVSVECLHEGYGSASVRIFYDTVSAHDSVFEIISFPFTNLDSGYLFTGTFSYCTLKIYVCTPKKTSYTNMYIFGDQSHDNVLIMNFIHDDGNETTENIRIRSNITAIDTEYSSGANFTADNKETIYKLTTKQIKSESYLHEIGFIP